MIREIICCKKKKEERKKNTQLYLKVQLHMQLQMHWQMRPCATDEIGDKIFSTFYVKALR